ncbi:MAG: peptidyl-prolyl cis-trans isomerase [Sedimentisphaerales bacterium]|nr:peptidyl-prolyl cis-trans isomerase [Sedimentisphaerales bacterium]
MTTARNGVFIVAISMLFAIVGSATAADTIKPAAAGRPSVMQTPTSVAEPNLATGNPDEVMAKYGDQTLTLRDIMFFIPAPTATSAKQLVQQWLELQMMYDAAKVRGLTEDPKSKITADLNSKQIFAKELMNKIAADVNIPESQVRKYYDENKTTDPQLSEPDRFSFTHIKVKTAEEANSIKKRFLENENIEKMAKELSIAPDGKTGGSVKKLPQAMIERQYGGAFVNALANASEGMIIGPIKVQDGFEVARHEGKLASKVKPFEDVAPTIKRDLEQKSKMEAMEKFRETLKKDSESKSYISPLLGSPTPKAEGAKSAGKPNLPVDKTNTPADNAIQKK